MNKESSSLWLLKYTIQDLIGQYKQSINNKIILPENLAFNNIKIIELFK